MDQKWTLEDYETLKKHIASGIKTVAYSDRRVEYRSLDEMLKALELMEDELFPRQKRQRVYMSCSTGIKS